MYVTLKTSPILRQTSTVSPDFVEIVPRDYLKVQEVLAVVTKN